ncbi:MAG: quinone-dependent dihydroorotate dehydrogenase [Gammaproteobacteria bacterium]|nr:quinone-dependent dihydroorotate dehydrogenase [Gammaproteobacteria bacterium]
MRAIYPLLRQLLFLMDAEKAHDFSLAALRNLHDSPLRFLLNQSKVDDPFELWGLKFPNRVGLAAGLDKNGRYLDALGAMGFGFVEVGTVTPKPQPGNDKPRMFRLPESAAIINRMGFNNDGVDQLVENIKQSEYQGVLGINIGKNKSTPEEKAVDDYLIGMEKVYEHADYITVNISSPNTPGLRNLQFGEVLDELLKSIKEKQASLTSIHNQHVPVLVKIAPDLTDEEIEQVADSFLKFKIDGVIATNTTLSREQVSGQEFATEQGGLSGKVLAAQSTEVLAKLNQALKGQIPTIGVGGVHDELSAIEKIKAGASLIQIYSCFIYQGPALIYKAAQALKQLRQQ